MKSILAVILLVLASVTLAAEDHRMRLVQPKGTELTLTKLARDQNLYANFAGQIWLSGTVVGHWPAGATNREHKEPDFLLVPDRASIDRLPHFVLREPPYFNQYKVRSIELTNGSAALRIAVGDERTRKLLERRVNHVRATGRFLIERYVVGVECDAPWARAVLVRAELPDQVARHYAVPEGC